MKLINADELIQAISDRSDIDQIDIIRSIINTQKEIEIKEGRWIFAGSEGYECSECWRTTKNPKFFCPICGSRNKKHNEGVSDERSE